MQELEPQRREEFIPPIEDETAPTQETAERPAPNPTEAPPEQLEAAAPASVKDEGVPIVPRPGKIPREFQSQEGAREWVNGILAGSSESNLSIGEAASVEDDLIKHAEFKKQRQSPET